MTERSRWAIPRLARVAAAWMAAVALGAGVLAAQGTAGKIEGTVRDQSGAPVNGAQVFIVGTAYAGVTNERGYYFINNVPAGTMVVRAQYIGFSPAEVRNVRVFSGQTMTINIPMEQRAIEVSGVTVTVEQTPIVPRDQVASKSIASGEVIQNLPVDAVAQVLRLQPGVVEGRGGNLTIRGGRPGEAATYIDGVLVRSLTGNNTISVGTNALEEASVTTGAMGAEYGEAQSGVVSLVTRAGGQRLRGNLSFATDDPAGQVYGTGFNRVEASLGGPIARNLTFFLATALDGQQNGRRAKGAEDIPVYVLNGVSDTVTVARNPLISTGDSQLVELPSFERYSEGARLPRAWSNSYTIDGNMQYTFGTGSRIRLTAHQTRNEGLNYPGRGSLYNTSSQYGFWNMSNALILNWTQNLAQSSERALFFEATVSWQHDQGINSIVTPEWAADHKNPSMWFTLSKPDFLTTFETFPIDEALLQNLRLNDCRVGRDASRPNMGGCLTYIDRQDLLAATEFRLNPYGITPSNQYYPTTGVLAQGGPGLSEETRLTGRVNFDWQANRYNRVRFGGDFVKSDISAYGAGNTNQSFLNAYIDHPVRYGLYLSDRIDLGDVVLDLGLRYDRMDSKIKYPRSPGRVYTDPIRDGNYSAAYTADDTAMTDECIRARAANDLAALSTCNYFTAKPRGVLAPSIRVSFPVTDRTGFRLSYAHQLQTPSFNFLATGVNSDLAVSNTNDLFGRDLDFGKTILFEFGIRHAFSDDMVLDFSAYNKDKLSDITGRTLPVVDPFDGAVQMINMMTNADFGNVRGVDIRLDRRIGQLFQGTISYTYQTAMTTGSDPNEYLRTFARQISSVTGERVSPPQALLTSADNRIHTIAGNVALNFPSGWRSGTLVGRLLENTGLNATFRAASGLPYTRLFNTGAGTTGPGNGFGNSYTGTEQLNSASMPWIRNVDLRVTRALRVGGRDLTLFADLRNLFNWTNLTAIYAETGDVVNDLLRTKTLSPIIETLRNEAGDRWETRAVEVNGVSRDLDGVYVGTTRAECNGYASNRFYGRPNCLMLQQVEANPLFGNGDGFFDSLEQDKAFGAWYTMGSGPQVFRGTGLNIRFGFELNF